MHIAKNNAFAKLLICFNLFLSCLNFTCLLWSCTSWEFRLISIYNSLLNDWQVWNQLLSYSSSWFDWESQFWLRATKNHKVHRIVHEKSFLFTFPRARNWTVSLQWHKSLKWHFPSLINLKTSCLFLYILLILPISKILPSLHSTISVIVM